MFFLKDRDINPNLSRHKGRTWPLQALAGTNIAECSVVLAVRQFEKNSSAQSNCGMQNWCGEWKGGWGPCLPFNARFDSLSRFELQQN